MEYIPLKLGDHEFIVTKTCYNKLSRVRQYNYVEHDRTNDVKRIRYQSRNPEQIDLDGVIMTYLSGKKGLEFCDKLALDAEKGEPLLLVDGLGKFHGKFAVTRISDTKEHALLDGIPQKITFKITIREYND